MTLYTSVFLILQPVCWADQIPCQQGALRFTPPISPLQLFFPPAAPPAVEAVVWAFAAGRRWRCWAACLLCAPWACWGSPSAPTTGSTWRRASSCPSTRPPRCTCRCTAACGGSVSWQVSGREDPHSHHCQSVRSQLDVDLHVVCVACDSVAPPACRYNCCNKKKANANMAGKRAATSENIRQ